MRKTPNFDKTKNEYISKLEKLYLVNPVIFYAFINFLMQCEYLVGYMDFSTKTECLKLPERDKIYPATIFHSYYEVFILSTQKDLLDQKSLKKYFETQIYIFSLQVPNSTKHLMILKMSLSKTLSLR